MATRPPPVRWKVEQAVGVCWYGSEDVRKNVPDVIIVHSQKEKNGKEKKQKSNKAEEEVSEEGDERGE